MLICFAAMWRSCYLFNKYNINVIRCMHFGRKNVGYNYHLDTKSLDEVSEEKDLGVTIICDLKASLKVHGGVWWLRKYKFNKSCRTKKKSSEVHIKWHHFWPQHVNSITPNSIPGEWKQQQRLIHVEKWPGFVWSRLRLMQTHWLCP